MSGPNEPRIPEVESVVMALRQCGASALLASAELTAIRAGWLARAAQVELANYRAARRRDDEGGV